MDSMDFTNYQVTDKEYIHIFERLNESAALNMELAVRNSGKVGFGQLVKNWKLIFRI